MLQDTFKPMILLDAYDIITKIIDIKKIILSILLVCSSLPFLPSLCSTSEITGIKVIFIADLKKFPIKVEADRAMKKVSVTKPEPNFAAIKTSLRNPRNLLPRVNIIITNADLASLPDFDIIYTPTLVFHIIIRIK